MASSDMVKASNLMQANRSHLLRQQQLRTQLETVMAGLADLATKAVPPDFSQANLLVQEIQFLNKKVKDNALTVSQILSDLALDSAYYAAAGNSLLRAARFYSTTAPTMGDELAETAPFDVQFINAGTLYSWTADKQIYLRIRFVNSANETILTHDEPLVIDEENEINVPGDPLVNGDYGLIKTWSDVVLTIPSDETVGTCNMIYTIVEKQSGKDVLFNASRYETFMVIGLLIADMTGLAAETSLAILIAIASSAADGAAAETCVALQIAPGAADLTGTETGAATGLQIAPAVAALSGTADEMVVATVSALETAAIATASAEGFSPATAGTAEYQSAAGTADAVGVSPAVEL